jgi:hypothetical protein
VGFEVRLNKGNHDNILGCYAAAIITASAQVTRTSLSWSNG